jgi:hypothetical protein
MNNAWITLTSNEYDKVWDVFGDKFKFNPSVHIGNFLGILEPSPSVTYQISEDFGDEDKVIDLDGKVLSALRSETGLEERIYVLDWQHECYWFYPHKDFQEWMIPVLPNGDYYIFLAEDFRFGIFGHPWEWTQCVWGKDLISFFEKSKPALWEEIIRRKP